MTQIIPGIYSIERRNEFITSLSGGNAPISALFPSGGSDQEWVVEPYSDRTFALKSSKSGRYIGFEGEAEANKPIVETTEPTKWDFRPSREPFNVFIAVPGAELMLDVSTLPAFPPPLALRPLSLDDQQAARQLQLQFRQ
ncbi:carbohydrate-binding module family 13 protein [Botryobasidium botryosum FD-172 SS1]|uniref:Carbohydrate-binding module family 13 protein n=1 Tax=Botryobasidium botryosum (strain FD-172 SS1) TaxID=930990 RepID=A0A067MTL7_BOTB1|nr:carbohydrate-binding module family 13 protein [Botryobasidium botryosum FD-172 SS1]